MCADFLSLGPLEDIFQRILNQNTIISYKCPFENAACIIAAILYKAQ